MRVCVCACVCVSVGVCVCVCEGGLLGAVSLGCVPSCRSSLAHTKPTLQILVNASYARGLAFADLDGDGYNELVYTTIRGTLGIIDVNEHSTVRRGYRGLGDVFSLPISPSLSLFPSRSAFLFPLSLSLSLSLRILPGRCGSRWW